MPSPEDVGARLSTLSPERRSLVEKLLRDRGSAAVPASRTIPRRPHDGPACLSFAQQRLWFLDQLAPGNPLYNMASVSRLSFPLAPAALERAINEVVRRHAVLRTTFTTRGGEPVQVVHDEVRVPLTIVDLRDRPAAGREGEAARLASADGQKPFDLERGPLLRTTLVCLDDAEFLLLIAMHHIAGDAWSMMVFSREMSVLYPAFAGGQTPSLPPLPIQYADFAEWQREWLQGESLGRALAYWTRQLADLPRLNVPTDRPRPAIQAFRGAYHPWAVDRTLAAGLRALGRTTGTTPFMTLLAAFAVVLQRYSGQTDVVLGTPVANRTRWEIEPLIGFFVNSLVLRVDLSGEPSFEELLRRVQKLSLDAFAHQELPFETLVQELQPARDASRNPLFQVTFQLFTPPGRSGLGTEQSMPPIHRGTAMFDIALSLVDNGTGFSGGFEYDTDLFDAGTIARMGEVLSTVLEGAVRDPRGPVSMLAVATEAQRHQVLVEWNATAAHYDGPPYLDGLFEAQAARTPQAEAVTSAEGRLTYGALDAQANALAARLRRIGVGSDRLVAICLERSADMVIALLAVLKAGGAYVPLDPAYPRERLRFMLADAGVHALIASRSLRRLFADTGVATICMDDEAAFAGGEFAHGGNGANGAGAIAGGVAAPSTQRRARDAAYVIYTSGSTGQPKGVVIEHRAICNHMQWMQERFPLTSADGVLQRTPFSFDASVWEFHAPLMAGARLVMLGPRDHGDPAAIVHAIRDEGITILQVVPSLLDLLLDEPEFDRTLPLRRVFCGGEALPARTVRRFHDRLDAELCNLYGPTETTIDASYWVSSGRLLTAFAPIGRPIGNVEIFILDPSRQPVPIGVQGEIYIGGAGVARGYVHRPELTRERFVSHPFSDTPDARLYRTGDAGRHLADGNVEFLGRLDHQVKLRGYRVELGEIEAALRAHAHVRDAAVLCDASTPRDQRLMAYVSPAGEGGDDLIRALRTHLQQRLPEYMMPDAFVLLDDLPRSPNGKVNRAALPLAERGASLPRPPYTAPRNEIEQTLAEAWAEVLRLESVGIHDNFFADLGGHSLLGTQLMSRVRSAFQIDLPLYRLFESPTIAELAPHVAEARRDPARRAAAPIPPLLEEGA